MSSFWALPNHDVDRDSPQAELALPFVFGRPSRQTLDLMAETVTYLQLEPGCQLPDITSREPRRTVVIVEAEVTTEWQTQVSDWLVQSGCLFMMAWGKNCSTWDDSVDFANIEQFGFGTIPENKFVMTTWHSDESLSEALWFAKYSANHPVVELKTTELLHISANNQQQNLVSMYASI